MKVLAKNGEPMHYTDITQAIATRGLKTKVGATPAASVAAAISISLQSDGDKSPFLKVGRGAYALKPTREAVAKKTGAPPEEEDETGFINAFGMYWRRDNVLWTATPKLLGQQQLGSQPVNFWQQKGVYLLHDGSKVVYVGRTTDQPLGVRLKQHTSDRLNGRWDRFSWFGVFLVQRIKRGQARFAGAGITPSRKRLAWQRSLDLDAGGLDHFPHIAVSVRTFARVSSGEMPDVSEPPASTSSFTSGTLRTFITSA